MSAKPSVERLLEDLERQLLMPRARKSELVFELLAEEFVGSVVLHQSAHRGCSADRSTGPDYGIGVQGSFST